MLAVTLMTITAAGFVAFAIWHGRQQGESGESALRIATRDIHEWWRR